jgi:hypothetical protein
MYIIGAFMAKTPTKLDILLKLNDLINSMNNLNLKYDELLAKLDTDTGVSGTNYSSSVNIEPFSSEQLSAMDQLINLRE